MKYNNYTDLGIISAKKPFNTHLFWELNNGYLLLIDSTSRRDLLISTDKGANWDSFGTGSFTSGKITDDRNIVAGFFDRANDKIYFIGWETGVDGDKIQCWELDVSTYTASDIGASIDADNAAGDGIGLDVWLRDGNLEVLLRDDNGGSLRWEVFKWVDPNWVYQNFVTVQDTIYFPAVIIGTNAFFVSVLEATHTASVQRWTGAALTIRDGIATVDGPSDDNMLSLSYDGNDLIYFPLYSTGDAENRLYSWSITGVEETKLGKYDVVLMLDRNTASGVLEKAFHLTEYKIYQIQKNAQQLNLIAVPNTDAVIIAITDNFIINDDGDMWELEDQIGLISSVIIDHETQEASRGIITLIKGAIPIVKNLFMRFLYNYTTAVPPTLYKATYNFKDEADGTSGTDIDWVTSIITNTVEIVSDWQSHKKVLKCTSAGGGSQYRINHQFTAQADGNIEFWIGTPDATDLHAMHLRTSTGLGVASTVTVVYILNDVLFGTHGNGAGGTTTINLGAIIDDQIAHVKIYFDSATDKISIWRDGTLYIDDENFDRDNTFSDSQIQYIVLFGPNVANATAYFDAWGESWDPDYNVGDNLLIEAEEKIIFEGLVTNFTEDQMQTVTLISPAKKEIKTILPEGDYTKDSDGLISQLIIDYNNYITEGTLSDGGDLGIFTLGGVLTEETIFDGCAKFDGFIWYFDPTGQTFYNDGTVDSTIDYTQANVLSGVNISHVHEEYNRIKVRGAYIAGVQMESAWQEDLDSQQRLGINERIFLISFLNTVATCNIAAANILTILAKDPIRVKFTIKDTTTGYIQVGETITFEYSASGKTVSSDQFIIMSASINKYGDIRYTITSELS